MTSVKAKFVLLETTRKSQDAASAMPPARIAPSTKAMVARGIDHKSSITPESSDRSTRPFVAALKSNPALKTEPA
jgi:hypothetical protein